MPQGNFILITMRAADRQSGPVFKGLRLLMQFLGERNLPQPVAALLDSVRPWLDRTAIWADTDNCPIDFAADPSALP